MTARRRTSALVLTLAAAAAAAASPTTATAGSPLPPQATCLPKGAKSLAVSPTARVYRKAVDDDSDVTGIVSGCYRPTGKRYRLVTETDDDIETATKLGALKLSGRYVAYMVTVEDFSCKDACRPGFPSVQDVLRVADLRARTTRVIASGLLEESSLKVTSTSVSYRRTRGDRETETVPLAPPRSRAAKKTCSRRGTETLASNDVARVYSRDANDNDEEFTTDVVYGCWRSSGRHVQIAEEYDDAYVLSGSIDDLKLSGRYVVYVYTETDDSCKADCPVDYNASSSRVLVMNLKTRRERAIGGGDSVASLKVTGSTATWTADGKTQRASLK
jgi:hypothetical protein